MPGIQVEEWLQTHLVRICRDRASVIVALTHSSSAQTFALAAKVQNSQNCVPIQDGQENSLMKARFHLGKGCTAVNSLLLARHKDCNSRTLQLPSMALIPIFALNVRKLRKDMKWLARRGVVHRPQHKKAHRHQCPLEMELPLMWDRLLRHLHQKSRITSFLC